MPQPCQSQPDHLESHAGPTFCVLSLRVERRNGRVLLTGRTHEGKQVTLSLHPAVAMLDCLCAAQMGRIELEAQGLDIRKACNAVIVGGAR
ncbi:MAG: hypothetical protein WC378_09025 [Opitutaceae bacterium]|jgi:hypothetical protein